MAIRRGPAEGPFSQNHKFLRCNLSQVLRKYSDKTIAKNLVEELESYGGDPSNLVLSS